MIELANKEDSLNEKKPKFSWKVSLSTRVLLPKSKMCWPILLAKVIFKVGEDEVSDEIIKSNNKSSEPLVEVENWWFE